MTAAGKSLGSCPTSHLASRCAVRGVIIVSGLASGARVLFPTTKVYLTDAMFFNNVGRLATNTCAAVRALPLPYHPHRLTTSPC